MDNKFENTETTSVMGLLVLYSIVLLGVSPSPFTFRSGSNEIYAVLALNFEDL